MIEKPPIFQTAEEFVSERVKLGSIIKRVGVVINANFNDLQKNINVGERLNLIIDSALDKVENALDEKFGAIASEYEKLAVQFFYAQSRKVSSDIQVEMLESGKNSTMVSLAAANQRHVPEALQFSLLEHCKDHASTMRALIAKTDLHPMILGVLAKHPHSDVRLDVARHIGLRMKINENLTQDKQNAYNAIVDNFEPDYADYLIPVCKNSDQIQQMFDETPMIPSKVRLFVDNPYSPDRVLLDIISSTVTKLMPGGNDVVDDARKALDNRLHQRNSENTSTPEF